MTGPARLYRPDVPDAVSVSGAGETLQSNCFANAPPSVIPGLVRGNHGMCELPHMPWMPGTSPGMTKKAKLIA